MNAKQSLIWFVVGIVWLAGFGLSFAHASSLVGADLKQGLIWFGASILWGVLGVFGGVKLNKKR
jgi:hypothetical protein